MKAQNIREKKARRDVFLQSERTRHSVNSGSLRFYMIYFSKPPFLKKRKKRAHEITHRNNSFFQTFVSCKMASDLFRAGIVLGKSHLSESCDVFLSVLFLD